MTILPKVRAEYGEDIGVQIYVQFPYLSGAKTYLSADSAVGVSSLSVENGFSFAVGQYAVLGMVGSEKSEIVRLHTVTTPTASAITLNAVTSFAHNRGDSLQFIPYNQIIIQRSTNGGSSYSDLATIDIRSDATETFYADTTGASTYLYRAKFYNSSSTSESASSDAVLASGLVWNAVGAIKARALQQTGEVIGGIISDSFLNESLWEARREVDNSLKRWSFRESFNSVLGTIAEGANSMTVPTTLRNPSTNQNIRGLRTARTGRNIDYIDKRAWDQWYEGKIHTTVATQPSVGQTTLVLTETGNLADSGSVQIGSNTITYTAKNNSTNTLSGIPASGDGSITATHAAGTDVWQNIAYGEPTRYTIFNGRIYFNVPFDSTFEASEVLIDFYNSLPEYDSDSDVLDEPEPDMFVSYLKYKIKYLKDKGKIKRENDDDYQEYIQKLSSMIRKERTGQDVRMVPNIGHLQGQD